MQIRLIGYTVTMKKSAKKRGRPPIDNPASNTLGRVRVSDEQLEAYRQAGAVKGKSLSEWVRDTLDAAAKRVNRSG